MTPEEKDILLRRIYPDSPVDLTKQPEAYLFPDGSVNKKGKQMMQEEIETSARQGYAYRNDWQKRYPKLAWLQKERMFIRYFGTPKIEIVLFHKGKDDDWKETIVKLEAQHKALLLFFLEKGDEGLLLSRKTIKQASEQILKIYFGIRPETETTEQFKKEQDAPGYNDWFHKLRTAFNDAAKPYGLKIENKDNRYELKRPREVSWDEQAYRTFLQKKKQWAAAIKKETTLLREEEKQRIESIKSLNPETRELLKKITSVIMSPFKFPIDSRWYFNTKVNRIIWCVDEKKVMKAWCGVDEGAVQRNIVDIVLPAKAMALLLLFASHIKDGVALKEVLPDGKLHKEYCDLYKQIGGSKVEPQLKSKKPLQLIRDLMASIKRRGTGIDFRKEVIDNPKDNLYYIKGAWALVRI